MIGHHLHTAWLNLRRSPWLTALIVIAIAMGIGSSMTAYSVLHAMTRDPLPSKSERLFAPRLDTPGLWSPAATGEPDVNLTYRDATALRDGRRALRQAVMYETTMLVAAEAVAADARLELVRATDGDFFDMFAVPFLMDGRSRAWSLDDDAHGARVVVLGEAMAQRLFQTTDVVGRNIWLNGHVFRIVGVTGRWMPTPRFYDLSVDSHQAFQPSEQIFVPLAAATALIEGFPRATANCPPELPIPGNREGWLRSECLWTQLWVELPTAADVGRFDNYLREYATEQQRSGRFGILPGTRLRNVPDMLLAYKATPDDYRLTNLLACCFLAVCLLDAMGLMMARFSSRAMDLGLRRALGASRRSLFAQCLTEAGLIGALGGAAGLLLLGAGLWAAGWLLPPELARLAEVDGTVVALATGLAVAGAALAGLYPAWQASHRSGLTRLPRRGDGRAGAVLIALQVAVTLGILTNALSVVWQKLDAAWRSTGADEAALFMITSSWQRQYPDLPARVDRDLTLLRTTPGAVDATAANLPLMPNHHGLPLILGADETSTTAAAVFFGDESTSRTWNATPVEGRWFSREEVTPDPGSSTVAVINRVLAGKFPEGRATGELLRSAGPEGLRARIIGVVDVRASDRAGSDYLVFLPVRDLSGSSIIYTVRVRPGQLPAVMREAERRMSSIGEPRSLHVAGLEEGLSGSGVKSFGQVHDELLRGARGLAVMLAVTCTLLLLVNALGIFGLTSYWVLRRYSQIGVRRALGAPRADIVLRFQRENLLIVGAGVLVGAALTVAGNLWLVQHYEMPRLAPVAVFAGAAFIVLASQLVVFWPARRASLIPPAVATRNV